MSEETEIDMGEVVYDDDGNRLGTIRGFDEHGFYVSTEDGVAALSIEHVRAGGTYGEAELMWRCWECGEMGDIEAVPDECPNCGAASEEIYYWIED
jgi:hypothetical protein